MGAKTQELSELMEILNKSNTAAIEADRLQDDRIGKQLDILTNTSEKSHQHASKSLQMILLRYGEAHLVPEALFSDINKDGRRLDKKIIELKIARKFPNFEIIGNPIAIQLQFEETKAIWNENVLAAIRAARVSTSKSNAVYSAIQLIAAQQQQRFEQGSDELLEMA